MFQVLGKTGHGREAILIATTMAPRIEEQQHELNGVSGAGCRRLDCRINGSHGPSVQFLRGFAEKIVGHDKLLSGFRLSGRDALLQFRFHPCPVNFCAHDFDIRKFHNSLSFSAAPSPLLLQSLISTCDSWSASPFISRGIHSKLTLTRDCSASSFSRASSAWATKNPFGVFFFPVTTFKTTIESP